MHNGHANYVLVKNSGRPGSRQNDNDEREMGGWSVGAYNRTQCQHRAPRLIICGFLREYRVFILRWVNDDGTGS